MIYFIINIIRVFLLIMFLLVGIAFLTLLERKILGYVQYRKGPNKVGFIGIIQPFRDAIKLFIKENLIIYKSNYYIYYLSPLIIFLVIMICWLTFP